MSHKNISRLLATDVINELYEVAKLRPQIMAINWLGYAYLTICNQLADTLSLTCDCIDEYMESNYMSDFVKEFIKINPNWIKLKDWHTYHWNLSQRQEYESDYEMVLTMTKLELPHYTLEI